MNYAALAELSYERLQQWDLTKKQRAVAYWIVRLSYGSARGQVWITGLLISKLTGMHPPDVSYTIGGLQRLGILHVRGSAQRPRCFTFMPQAVLMAPDSAVDESTRTEALLEIARLNAAAAGGAEPTGQRPLDIATVQEQLDREQIQASRELAMEQGSAIAPPVRTQLEHALREHGWTPSEIEASRQIPLDRLQAGLQHLVGGVTQMSESLIERHQSGTRGVTQMSDSLIERHQSDTRGVTQMSDSLIERHQSDTRGVTQMSESLIERHQSGTRGVTQMSDSLIERHQTGPHGVTQMSESLIERHQMSESLMSDSLIEKAVYSVGPPSGGPSMSESLISYSNSHLTVNCTEISEQLPVRASHQLSNDDRGAPMSDSLIEPKRIADPDLLRELQEIIGAEVWSSRTPDGKGNWGATWRTALTSSPVAHSAVRQAIASYKTCRLERAIHKPGGWMWQAFVTIQRSLLRTHRAKPRKQAAKPA